MPRCSRCTRPSRYRIAHYTSELTDIYDSEPRTGSYYWRVRALDAAGRPMTVWSAAQHIELAPASFTVAVFGDSISHGGGRLSYGPSDWAYSYASYLDVPVVNLSESGDTSARMAERFAADIRPFRQLKTVLILGGTNSLRASTSAESVIEDLKSILGVETEYWLKDFDNVKEFYAKIGDTIPAELQKQLADEIARLQK